MSAGTYTQSLHAVHFITTQGRAAILGSLRRFSDDAAVQSAALSCAASYLSHGNLSTRHKLARDLIAHVLDVSLLPFDKP